MNILPVLSQCEVTGAEAYAAALVFAAAEDSGFLRLQEYFLEIRRMQVSPWTDAFCFWKKTQPWSPTIERAANYREAIASRIGVIEVRRGLLKRRVCPK